MAFDIHISIPDNSPAFQVVRRVAAAEQITPDQAAARLLDEAAKMHNEASSNDEIWGAFSSEEDAAIWDQATQFIQERRQQDQLRDLTS